ncbi:hypothetical protein KCP73_03185 [Salmonella enterica subsp. enterica]|nr:hypothetical protein KCP73_03185 [Salmonella enterica subsp. enterica]
MAARRACRSTLMRYLRATVSIRLILRTALPVWHRLRLRYHTSASPPANAAKRSPHAGHIQGEKRLINAARRRQMASPAVE